MDQRKIVVFIATSLDGYIATEDESLDWLFKVEGEGDNGYSEFYETVDTIVMGRKTYDWIKEKEKDNFPYKNKKCYVYTKTLKGRNQDVEFISGNVLDFVKTLKETNGKNIWIVGGGELLFFFIKEGLVDEYFITIAPTLIGKGIPLFKQFDNTIELKLLGIKRYNQFVELHYEPK